MIIKMATGIYIQAEHEFWKSKDCLLLVDAVE